jgi:hypothetical protein
LLLNYHKANISVCRGQKDMMLGRVVIDCLIAFARIDMNHHFHKDGQLVKHAVTRFFGNEVTLQGGQLAIYSNVYFAI